MALDSVTKEILAEAEASAAKIREEQAAEIKAVAEQTEAQIADMKEKQNKKVADAVDVLARQESSSAELESKNLVLSKKKEILERAFASALADLEGMPADRKLAYYQAMVASAKKVIPAPKALIPEGDEFTAEQLGVVSVAKDARIASGLILQSEDGEIEVDMQYSVLLRGIWDRNLNEVSRILFG